MRWTWRKLAAFGSFLTRYRCCTFSPRCASPCTPSPWTRQINGSLLLLNVWPALRLTAVTMAGILLALSFAYPARSPGGLILLQARQSDHLSPHLCFIGDELAKPGWRVDQHCPAD